MSVLHLIHIGWRVKYGAKSWSWGHCDSCQQEGPVRFQDFTERLYLNAVIPLSRGKKGKLAHCDFCRRNIQSVENYEGIPFKDWSPQEGLDALCKRCGISPTRIPAQLVTDTRLHSLLSAIEKKSPLVHTQIGPLGILGGGILAPLIAIPLAMWLHQNQIVQPQMDQEAFILLAAGLSIVPGIVIGAVVESFLRRDRSARTQLWEAYRDYPFDLLRLEELSRDYGKNVRKVVHWLSEQALRNQ